MFDGININIHICGNSFTETHSHNFFELAYVTKGRAIHTLNGFEKMIGAGDFFILDYDANHSYYEADGNDFEVIVSDDAQIVNHRCKFRKNKV